MFTYDAHEFLVSPARARPGLWRLFFATILIVVLGLGTQIGIGFAIGFLGGEAISANLIDLSTSLGTLVALFSFACFFFALWLVMRILYRRSFWSLLGPERLAGRYFVRAALVLGALALLSCLIPLPETMRPVPNFEVSTWAILLPVGLLGLVIQVSCEEFLFRGFLQSQLAARFSSPAIWVLVPSVLFGLLHYAPYEFGGNAWWIVLWATVFGIFAADLTARSGSLGPAIAMHLVNNIMALLFVAIDGDLSGLSLWVLPISPSDTEAMRPLLLLEAPALLVMWLSVRIAIKR